jgi:hypothetical protein
VATPVVSNTGPLIALAKIDRLPLLKALFERVRIPPAVHQELLAKKGEEMEHLLARSRNSSTSTAVRRRCHCRFSPQSAIWAPASNRQSRCPRTSGLAADRRPRRANRCHVFRIADYGHGGNPYRSKDGGSGSRRDAAPSGNAIKRLLAL